MKLSKIREVKLDGKNLIYVGHFEGAALSELEESAIKKGLESEFYCRPFAPYNFYLEEPAFEKFNQ